MCEVWMCWLLAPLKGAYYVKSVVIEITIHTYDKDSIFCEKYKKLQTLFTFYHLKINPDQGGDRIELSF